MKFKIILIIVLSTIFSLSLFADKVDIESARNVAKNLYYERINEFTDTDYHNISFSEDIEIKYNTETVFYAFNIGNDKGFVMISADNNAYPVLAYSFHGKYSEVRQPPALKSMVLSYKNQLSYIIKNDLASNDEIDEAWQRYSSYSGKSFKAVNTVGPLLTTLWDQGVYYNQQCPSASGGPGDHVYTGCVATAMAQVLRYHQHPSQGVGSHNYYSTYGYLSANYGTTSYNWSNMPTTLLAPNYDVAQLMSHCGISIDMNYSTSGSWASTSDAAYAFYTYFKYSPSCEMKLKSYYTDIYWKIMLRADLINSRPLMYRGQDQTYGGHSFVCDGFQYPDHFHFNWGWGGSNDGYFYVTSLNSGYYDFTYEQGAIFNLYPSTNSGTANIEEEISNSEVLVYPNPNNGDFTIDLNSEYYGDLNISINDLSGKLIYSDDVFKSQNILINNISIPDINKGMYFISFSYNGGKISRKLFVK